MTTDKKPMTRNPNSGEHVLGIDVGSISVDVVVLDQKMNMIFSRYGRHYGQPDGVLYEFLKEILNKYTIRAVAVTGSGAKRLCSLLGAMSVNEVISQATAAAVFYPHVHSVIDIGGQDSKLILLEPGNRDLSVPAKLKDFAMSAMCSAGTGSFLDQQSERLGISIEKEFGEMALRSKNPARIAGRCSVFAKSDMIHLQQKGTPVHDIVAGLCYALARNFKSSVAGSVKIIPSIAFVGGVAANKGVIKAFEDILELNKGEMLIPEHFALMGAAGAAIWLMINGPADTSFLGAEVFIENCKAQQSDAKRLPPLTLYFSQTPVDSLISTEPPHGTNVYLGIDVGSISTNIVLMDEKRNLIAKYYLMTASRPIEAVRKGFRDILKKYEAFIKVKGIGVTGSGRYLIGDLVGADVIKNEITAHARAGVFVDPQVDTIFEIGGQDSKYIHLTDGLVDDFAMNKACAAGTGSFLEEQAEKLNISIEKDFADLALSAEKPVDCGAQCTVFMDSEVVHHQQKGIGLSDITAGLAYSIVFNYLDKVVEKRTVGDHIFFQGGVAFNQAVVAAFELLTKKPITVPENHEVMGAIGSCLLAMGQAHRDDFHVTRFKGFDVLERDYHLETFECGHCSNHCEINKVMVSGERALYYGGRCERYEIKKKSHGPKKIRDLLKEREKLLLTIYDDTLVPEPKRGIIGYPRVLTFYEYYPFFKAFFTELGLKVLLSPPTNSAIIREGVACVASPTCFPTKVAHGHVAWMKEAILEGKADYMFLPSLRETFATDSAQPYANHCSYVQFIPDLTNEALKLEENGIKILKPILHFRIGEKQILREMDRMAHQVGVKNRGEIKRALNVALETHQRFRQARIDLGNEVLAQLRADEKAVVLVGKAHNLCDPGTSLNMSRIWRDLGIMSVPMDLLDMFQSPDVGKAWRNMTLAMGQRTVTAANIIRQDPRLYAVYVTNFGCVNDSLYPLFFKREIGHKPFLLLEIDEHSAEAGIVTRCEAFMDSLENIKDRKTSMPKRVRRIEFNPKEGRTLYLPHAANAMAVWAAALKASGVNAQVLPPPGKRSLYWGEKCLSGKECLPCTLMTGDMIRLMKDSDVDPKKVAFYMPGSCGSCRYDLFNTLQQIVFEDFGLGDVALVDEYKGANVKLHAIMDSRDYGMLAWKGFIAGDILEKLRLHIRPYECNEGETDKNYQRCLDELVEVIESRGNVEKAVVKNVKVMSTIKIDRSIVRPLIGLVGEAYLRNVDYASNYLIQTIERLGAEVRIPAVIEVLWYTLYKQRYYSKAENKKVKLLVYKFQHNFLTRIEKRLRRYTQEILPHPYESRIWNIIEESGFTLDAGLGFGTAIEMAQQDVRGIVHAIPFNCVPGLVIQGLEGRFRAKYPHIPFLTVAFRGHNDPSLETRLEALVYQCSETYNAQRMKNSP